VKITVKKCRAMARRQRSLNKSIGPVSHEVQRVTMLASNSAMCGVKCAEAMVPLSIFDDVRTILEDGGYKVRRKHTFGYSHEGPVKIVVSGW
jgi:hypothetical protein